ncbi:MAG: mannosyltransferase [bacterium]
MKPKIDRSSIAAIFGAIIFYILFAYDLERTDWIKLLGYNSLLFLISFHLLQKFRHNLKTLSYIAFGFRAVFIFAIPNLSQDFYRFIWDGQMILNGFNPYLYTPISFFEQGNFPFEHANKLYHGMGSLSANNFTNYPPVNQLLFTVAGLFYGKQLLFSVIGLRLIIIAADFGVLHYGRKLLKRLALPEKQIFLYILNPFIIIELTGNLHFEGVMIFFLIWSLYLLQKGSWIKAAMVLALSISTKLIPLILLPLFWQWFMKRDSSTELNDEKPLGSAQVKSHTSTSFLKRFSKLVAFYGIIGLVNILLFLPFFSNEFITNYSKTVGLWFSKFEFNASLYYIAREIGYTFRGYNEIEIIGKYIPILVIIVLLILTFFRKNGNLKELMTSMLLGLTIYFFLSTTVHPWYIATLIMLSVFTNYRFPLVWSFIVIISYLAYLNANNTENLWIIGLEYLVVYSYFIWEVLFKRRLLA